MVFLVVQPGYCLHWMLNSKSSNPTNKAHCALPPQCHLPYTLSLYPLALNSIKVGDKHPYLRAPHSWNKVPELTRQFSGTGVLEQVISFFCSSWPSRGCSGAAAPLCSIFTEGIDTRTDWCCATCCSHSLCLKNQRSSTTVLVLYLICQEIGRKAQTFQFFSCSAAWFSSVLKGWGSFKATRRGGTVIRRK